MDNKKLALFDFDGTIITGDSFLIFIRYYHGWAKFLVGMGLLSPILVLFKLGFIPNYVAKQQVLKWFFSGIKDKKFNEKATAFSKTIIPTLIKPKALQKLQEHRKNGDTIVVVSASPANWIRAWAEQNNYLLVATQLQVVKGRITGKISGENCYGPIKVKYVKQALDLTQYSEIYAYGDSNGDKEMLAFADHPNYRVF